MKLYYELAEWWPLLSPVEDYKEEANKYLEIIKKYKKDIKTALELGCGGGSNAFYLKKHFKSTLTDLSEKMLNNSRKINPECEHIQEDMRRLNLNKKFDLVFIQDAIMHIITEGDLVEVFRTAAKHLAPQGLLFIAPDWVKETFKPTTECGGTDGDNRGIRYLDWEYLNADNENLVNNDFIYVLKEEGKEIQIIHEKVQGGLFSKDTWKRLLEKCGFEVFFEVMQHSTGSYVCVVCKKLSD